MTEGAREPDLASEPAELTENAPVTLEDIQQDPTLSMFVASADRVMQGLGYTEHGFRHANLCGRIAFNVDLAKVMAAVGNHEEDYGEAAGPVAAAVILADKSDVHRSRVRKAAKLEFDIHDRVNYAAEQSFLRVDSGARTITLELTIDTEISQVMEYFEIFLGRMMMCRRAAEQLDCRFKLTINGAGLL